MVRKRILREDDMFLIESGQKNSVPHLNRGNGEGP